IIALPLLLGVGVAFKIYYIMAWRAGQTGLLQSSLTRAVMFSALTTATAFGSLWLSSHPGTSSIGKVMAPALLPPQCGGGAFPAGADGPPARPEAKEVHASHRRGRRCGTTSGSGRCRRRQVHIDLPVFHLGAERLEIDAAGRLHDLAARHVKRAEMQAAFDDVAFENAFAEIGRGVGALRLGGVEGAINVVDGHAFVPHLEALDVAGREVGGGTDANEIFCHGLTACKGD